MIAVATLDEWTCQQWAAGAIWYSARVGDTPIHDAERALARAFPSLETALRFLTQVDAQARRSGVPAAAICAAGATPAPDRPLAAVTARRLPVVPISTRPALSTLPSWTPGRTPTPSRPGTSAAPRTSPRRVEQAARPGTHLGGGVPGQRAATLTVMAGAAVMPVLLAVQIWRGTR